jgi:pyruvate/2-oxoacid:ferredoxin oxidoreductase alpha subunit/ferredoxin
MKGLIEKLGCKVCEGFQTSSIIHQGQAINAFHRTVTKHQSPDLSFIIGLISSGLRGSAVLDSDQINQNEDQFITAARQHLPLIVTTSRLLFDTSTDSISNQVDTINAIQHSGTFQFIANSAQEAIHLNLIAHRIAELSLIPGIVIVNDQLSEEEFQMPGDEIIQAYLGNPDDQIECPTPSQEMIFGKTRRRIPNWFSFEAPVLLGATKDQKSNSFEGAATHKYFYDHLPLLIDRACQEYHDLTGINFHPVKSLGSSSEFAVITIGTELTPLFEMQPPLFKKVELIQINQLKPFPSLTLASHLKGKKSVTLLEKGSSPHSAFYLNVLKSKRDTKCKLYRGKYHLVFEADGIEKVINHMTSNQPKSEYYIDIPFVSQSSDYPKHKILLQEIEKHYPDINQSSVLTDKRAKASESPIVDEIPFSIRRFKDLGPNYSQLARFYDNTAFFHKHQLESEIVADPMAAVPVLPGASAGFFSQSGQRTSLPIFNPKNCTGCGDCFIHCPHAALPPIAIGVEELLKAGSELLSGKGITITRLTPMIKNLAKAAVSIIQENDVSKPEDFLQQAFKQVSAQMKLEGEKLETSQHELELILKEVSSFPIAITDTFYNIPSSIEKGSGELFSMTVNPMACTGCSICAMVCDEEAFVMEPQNPENLEQIRNQFKLWEQLPDTSGHTISKLHLDEGYSSLAAILLSRNYYMTMSGAGDSEKNTAYKSMLHLVTATAESVVQPKILTQIKHIDGLIKSLSENVHQKLSAALPKNDLDQLSKSLHQTKRRKIHLQDVFQQFEQDEQGKLIDAEDLSRKTDLVNDLKQLKWVLSEGPTGVGRSRFGLLIDGSTSFEWAKKYPRNHFTSPCVIQWNGSAPEQTLGLYHGVLRYSLDHLKLIRRAELESKDKYDPIVYDPIIAKLGWSDLTPTEKKWVPPIFLVAERDDLKQFGWGSLQKLLAGKYPIKVFLFDHISSPDHDPTQELAQTYAGMISILALKNAFVFQGGMADAQYLFEGLVEGIDRPYPAFFNLYTINHKKHDIEYIDWTPYAKLAQSSRAFPAMYYDPAEKGGFLRGAIHLENNPSLKENWVEEEVTGSNETKNKYTITWADWAHTQSAWKSHFKLIEEESSITLIPEYLKLNATSRDDRIPAIMRADAKGVKYFAVTNKVIEMTEIVLSHWNMLQELAGVLTEFPTRLKEEITKEIKAEYEIKATEIQKEYEVKLKEMEASQAEILRQKLKEKLIALSSMAQSKKKA